MQVKQLNNGRFQVTVKDYDYSKLTPAVVAAVLWRSFSTQQEAFEFVQSVKGA